MMSGGLDMGAIVEREGWRTDKCDTQGGEEEQAKETDKQMA